MEVARAKKHKSPMRMTSNALAVFLVLTRRDMKDIFIWLQLHPKCFSLEEFVNQPPIVLRSICCKHLGDGITLSIRLDSKIPCKGVNVLPYASMSECAQHKRKTRDISPRYSHKSNMRASCLARGIFCWSTRSKWQFLSAWTLDLGVQAGPA